MGYFWEIVQWATLKSEYDLYETKVLLKLYSYIWVYRISWITVFCMDWENLKTQQTIPWVIKFDFIKKKNVNSYGPFLHTWHGALNRFKRLLSSRIICYLYLSSELTIQSVRNDIRIFEGEKIMICCYINYGPEKFRYQKYEMLMVQEKP